MKVIYQPEAEQELIEAAENVARRESSIEAGEQLLVDAAEAEALILQFPNASHPLGKGVRRRLLSRHEYQLVYRVEGDMIRIYAFAHQRRRGGYWRKRIGRLPQT